jgi:hypothetical protein
MADISQTPVNVRLRSVGPFGSAVAGETLVQGEPFYFSNSAGMRSRSSGTVSQARVDGIVLTPATVGQTFLYAIPGSSVDVGATLTVAQVYIVSANVGKIAPIGDLATTNYLTVLGVATTTSTLLFRPLESGAQKP